jgi:hypothetical protein
VIAEDFSGVGVVKDLVAFKAIQAVDVGLMQINAPHSIKVAIYSGDDKEDFLRRREFTGSVFK